MKLASLVPYKIIPPINGGEKAIYLFLKYMARYAEITSFSVMENKSCEQNILFKPVLGSTHQKLRYINPFLIFKIKNNCKKNGLHAIIMEHPYYAWLGYALQKCAGIKWIIRSHNIEAARFKSMNKWWWKILYQYERFAHRQADFSFFITEEDRRYAIENYGVSAEKCGVATYGVEALAAPTEEDKATCKKIVCEQLNLPQSTQLILFNGTLDYAPNRDGLDRILKTINPILQSSYSGSYKIIICGLRLPDEYEELQAWKSQNIIYKGFVENIELYFKAADVFINPITDGGGIKTKLVEALAAGTRSVSFFTGAFGVPQSAAGNYLSIVDNENANAFVEAIITQLNRPYSPITTSFYEHFSWDAIARRSVAHIANL